MKILYVVNHVNYTTFWLINHQELLIYYFLNIILAIIIMIIGNFFAKIFSNTLQKLFQSRFIDTTIFDFITAFLKYAIMICTIIAALKVIGVKTTYIVTMLGAAGIAISLALQGVLTNFTAGVLLVIFRPLKNGEYIITRNVAGTVLNIHIFYTTLRTLDGKIIVIPNSKITADNIINYSREPIRRNEFIINVSYENNIDIVINTLRTVLDQEPRVLQDKDIIVGLSELAPASMNFVVRCWTKTSELNAVYWDLMSQFKKALDKNKIIIPHPQLQLQIKNNDQNMHL